MGPTTLLSELFAPYIPELVRTPLFLAVASKQIIQIIEKLADARLV
tara:strand:- start:415 stop:552 length:138 start_codon:yes stop_codon:yes gene_type:complete